MNAQLQYQIEQFFYRKSELCDAQDWDAYLELFAPDSEFHLPQWDSEHVYTQDPKREMSLIYYANRSGLEDRIFRLRTGKGKGVFDGGTHLTGVGFLYCDDARVTAAAFLSFLAPLATIGAPANCSAELPISSMELMPHWVMYPSRSSASADMER